MEKERSTVREKSRGRRRRGEKEEEMLILAGFGAVELVTGTARGHVDTSRRNYWNLRQKGLLGKERLLPAEGNSTVGGRAG